MLFDSDNRKKFIIVNFIDSILLKKDMDRTPATSLEKRHITKKLLLANLIPDITTDVAELILIPIVSILNNLQIKEK